VSEDKDSKTEEASSRKLEKSREKGQVPRSEEFAPTIMFLFAVMYFWFGWDWLYGQIKDVFTSISFVYTMEFKVALDNIIDSVLNKVIFSIMLPFSLLMLFAGILGNILQFGFVFSVDPIIPRGDKISPIKGFGRVFSVKQVVKTFFSALKIIGMSIIIVYVVRLGVGEYMHELSQCNVECQMLVFQSLLKKLIMILLPILIIVAAMDFMFQRAQFLKEQRMTKDEVKREHKSQEGDPIIKGARRAEQRRLLEEDAVQRVKESRVLIAGVNLVIALQYEEDLPLPILLAIGKDQMSFKMIATAKKEKVKIVVDPALAQQLAHEGTIDQYIPSMSIKGVAKAIQQTAE